jgi:hypothetical protein
LTSEISPKSEIQKLKNEVILEVFSRLQLGKKRLKNLQIQLFGFHSGSEKYRRMIKYFYFISDL